MNLSGQMICHSYAISVSITAATSDARVCVCAGQCWFSTLWHIVSSFGWSLGYTGDLTTERLLLRELR